MHSLRNTKSEHGAGVHIARGTTTTQSPRIYYVENLTLHVNGDRPPPQIPVAPSDTHRSLPGLLVDGSRDVSPAMHYGQKTGSLYHTQTVLPSISGAGKCQVPSYSHLMDQEEQRLRHSHLDLDHKIRSATKDNIVLTPVVDSVSYSRMVSPDNGHIQSSSTSQMQHTQEDLMCHSVNTSFFPPERQMLARRVTNEDLQGAPQTTVPAPTPLSVSSAGIVLRFPCKARSGVDTKSHNSETAFIEVPPNTPHGTPLGCCHEQCAKRGKRYRYCTLCGPMDWRNFKKRHSHGSKCADAGNESMVARRAMNGVVAIKPAVTNAPRVTSGQPMNVPPVVVHRQQNDGRQPFYISEDNTHPAVENAWGSSFPNRLSPSITSPLARATREPHFAAFSSSTSPPSTSDFDANHHTPMKEVTVTRNDGAWKENQHDCMRTQPTSNRPETDKHATKEPLPFRHSPLSFGHPEHDSVDNLGDLSAPALVMQDHVILGDVDVHNLNDDDVSWASDVFSSSVASHSTMSTFDNTVPTW